MKQCTKCKKYKLPSEFYKAPTNKDGLCGDCKTCRNEYCQEHYKSHKAKYKICHRKYIKSPIGYIRHIFYDIKTRCNNPKYKQYKNYGGRGIKYKFKSSDEFVDYVINELKIDPRGLTIDRIDNDGDYEPGNIRFITQSENNKNR